MTAGSANIFLFRIVDRCPENITAEFVQICSQPVQWFNTRCHEVGHMPVLLPEISGSQQWELLLPLQLEENQAGLIRCERSPRTQCPRLSSG